MILYSFLGMRILKEIRDDRMFFLFDGVMKPSQTFSKNPSCTKRRMRVFQRPTASKKTKLWVKVKTSVHAPGEP